MMNIPNMVKVVDLQRGYRSLVGEMKRVGKPFLVLNNGDPDAVIMDVATYNTFTQKMRDFEELNLLRIAQEGIEELKTGRTKKLKKDQTLLDLIK